MKARISQSVLLCLFLGWSLNLQGSVYREYLDKPYVAPPTEPSVRYDRVHLVPKFRWDVGTFAGMDYKKHFMNTSDVLAELPNDCWKNAKVQRAVSPTNVCGLSGSVRDRVIDCTIKNPQNASVTFDECNPGNYGWFLVTKIETGEEVWLDMANELLISDKIVDDSQNDQFNWCWAGGTNSKNDGHYASKDPHGYCADPELQDQQTPVSLCYEDPDELNTPQYTKPAKGNLGIKEEVYWYLPTAEDYAYSASQGIRKIVPNLTTEIPEQLNWSSTLWAEGLRLDNVWSYAGTNGQLAHSKGRKGKNIVHCVAKLPPLKTKADVGYKANDMLLPQFIWDDIVVDGAKKLQLKGTKNKDHFVELLELNRYPKDCWCGREVWREDPRPTKSCGLTGSVGMRMLDCAEKNPDSHMKHFFECQQAKWQLVVKTETMEEVWYDHTDKVLVSDLIVSNSGKFRFNWCEASGTNGNYWGKYGSLDPYHYCNVGHYQDQALPTSLCYEDPNELYTPEYTHRAKGFLNYRHGVYWHTPTSREYSWSAAHGLRKVVQNLVRPRYPNAPEWYWSYWTSSARASKPERGWRFIENSREHSGLQAADGTRNNEIMVRCFANMPDDTLGFYF